MSDFSLETDADTGAPTVERTVHADSLEAAHTKLDTILAYQEQLGSQQNWIISVIKKAEAAIAASPMAKMMGQRNG